MTDSDALTVEDRLNIMDLLARYAACIDAHDGVAYAALFAPDGVRRIFPNSPGKANRTQRGREAIRADIQKAVDNWVSEVRHFTGQPIIEGNTNRCTVRSYCTVMVQMPDGPCAIEQVAEYRDICIKIDGRWLFAERAIHGLLDGHDQIQRKT